MSSRLRVEYDASSMAQFVSLWLFILSVTIGEGVAGYCFRGDLPAEPFPITDFVGDAVKSCRSCGINATRASTLLAREQLDVAEFLANASLNCLSFLNDVNLSAELWHKGGNLTTHFPLLTRPEENNTLVHFPLADRSVCLTSPSNFTLTSPPIVTFPRSTFDSANLLGFTLYNGGSKAQVLIFDSLQLDNLFDLAAPWEWYTAWPYGFVGLPELGNDQNFGNSVFGVTHNSVSYGFCDNSEKTMRFARDLPGVFGGQFSFDRSFFLTIDDSLSIAGDGVDCDPANIVACTSRKSFLSCCFTGETTHSQDARQCFVDQVADVDAYWGFVYNYSHQGFQATFKRTSVCTYGDSIEENEHCPFPHDICESAGCCLKTDPVTQLQMCVFQVATSPDKATVPLLVVEGLGGDGKANGAGFPTLIIVAVCCVATICIIAAAGFVRFDAENGRFYIRKASLWKRVHPNPEPPLHREYWEKSLRDTKGLPVVDDLLKMFSAGSREKEGLKGLRASRTVFMHNLDRCLNSLSSSDYALSNYDGISKVNHQPSGKKGDYTAAPVSTSVDIDAMTLHQGLITESKGIIIGNKSTYHIIKSLQGGCQSSCYLVSTKKDGGDCFFVAKVYASFQVSTQAVSEAYLLAQARHANVLEIFETFAHEETLVIITRFCEIGDIGTLAELSQHHGVAMDEMWIAEVFVQICLGLAHLHKTCIIHRDLKPSNIFMDKHGSVKIGDFGMSKMTTTHLADTIVGTPYYMAPEIHQGNPYSFSSDVWSLGVIVYYMCTKNMPFTADTEEQLEEKKNAGYYDKAMVGYSDGLVDLVSQMLQIDPTKRPTADEIFASPFVQETVTILRQHIKDVAVEFSDISARESQKRRIPRKKKRGTQ